MSIDNNTQTAFTIVGIPDGESDVAATDGLNSIVEAISDNLEEEATGEVDAKKFLSHSNES